MANIAVIIINYNSAELALAAVESVLNFQHGGRDVEIHLVDNASPAGDAKTLVDAAQVRNWGQKVTLYLEQDNHGFGRGNNLVLDILDQRDMPPEFVFLLNPDAQLKNEAIDIMATFLENHPEAAIAGARSQNPDSDEPVTAAFRFPGLLNQFSAALSFGPVARLLAPWNVPLSPDISTQQVGWVSGAAVMVRRKVWADLENFDPTYFLYYEEVDLMLQTARADWQCWHVAEAEIIHVEGASTNVKGQREQRHRHPSYWYFSWRHYFQKNYGRLYALAIAITWVVAAALNFGLSGLRGKTPAAPLHFFHDFWAMVIRPLLGLKPQPYD